MSSEPFKASTRWSWSLAPRARPSLRRGPSSATCIWRPWEALERPFLASGEAPGARKAAGREGTELREPVDEATEAFGPAVAAEVDARFGIRVLKKETMIYVKI